MKRYPTPVKLVAARQTHPATVHGVSATGERRYLAVTRMVNGRLAFVDLAGGLSYPELDFTADQWKEIEVDVELSVGPEPTSTLRDFRRRYLDEPDPDTSDFEAGRYERHMWNLMK